MKRKPAIVLGIVAVVVLVCIVGVMYFYSRMFYSRPSKPLPTGPAIEEPRSKANRDVARLFQDIDTYCAQAAIAYYDTGTLDECDVGPHNWRVNARFENRCRYRVTKYYGFSGDFRIAMMQLDSALVALGWARQGGGLPSMLARYYDRWYGPDKPKPGNFPHQYLVSNMPGVTYTHVSFLLSIRYEEHDPSGKAWWVAFDDTVTKMDPVRMMMDGLSYREARVVDTRALFPAIHEKNRYVLVIGITADDYFVN